MGKKQPAATWISESGHALVTHKCGKWFDSIGTIQDGDIYLTAEECLYVNCGRCKSLIMATGI